jgi:WD40 repeat protein
MMGEESGTVYLNTFAERIAIAAVLEEVVFSPDGKQVVSGSRDHTVQVWDATTGAALQTLKGHLELVTSVAFSPNSKQVVSGSYDGTMVRYGSGTRLQEHCYRRSRATQAGSIPSPFQPIASHCQSYNYLIIG